MLGTLDLDAKLDESTYKEARQRLGLDLRVLQRAAFERKIPVLILFEGWTASGKGDSIAQLVEFMDPRGFAVSTTRRASAAEAAHPLLWRFGSRTPSYGSIAIFDRSWYYAVNLQRLEADEDDREAWIEAMEEIEGFERTLLADGAVLIKFWLHISKKEQKRRIKSWAADEHQRWRVGEVDSRRFGYDAMVALADETLEISNRPDAPWTLVAAEDDRHRRVAVFEATVRALRQAFLARGLPVPAPLDPEAPFAAVEPHPDTMPAGTRVPPDSPLAEVDLELKLQKREYHDRLEDAQATLRDLHFGAYQKRVGTIVVFEGWDAGGKGGAIKRLTAKLDPRGYQVIPVAAPTAEEKQHHYLWRFWRALPKLGHIAIFDRSWYGRVLVERVEGFAVDGEWQRAYDEINTFEHAVVRSGLVLVKFWLQISPAEQLRRFRQRESTPIKRHKLTADDWRNRARYEPYLAAVDDMLRRTSTTLAPWTVVEAEDKRYARVKVIETVVTALERAL